METTEGFVVFDLPTYQTSAKEFAEKNDVDYATANGFLKFLLAQGVAQQMPSRKVEGKKGKPTLIYEVPTEVKLKLAA